MQYDYQTLRSRSSYLDKNTAMESLDLDEKLLSLCEMSFLLKGRYSISKTIWSESITASYMPLLVWALAIYWLAQ